MKAMSHGDQHEQDRGSIDDILANLDVAALILGLDDQEIWPRLLAERMVSSRRDDDPAFISAVTVRSGRPPVVLHAAGTTMDEDTRDQLVSEVLDSIDDDPIFVAEDPSFLAGRIDPDHVLVVQAASNSRESSRELLGNALRVFIPPIIAVERGRRLVETSRSLENHRLLERRIAETLSGVTNIRELGRAVNDLAAQLFDIEFTGIYFRDPESHNLRLVGAHGLDPDEIREAERTAWERHPGRVIRRGDSIMVEDTRADPDRRSVTPARRRVEIRSRCYLPVNSGGEIVGTLGLASSRPGAFGESHVEGMEFLADLAGLTWSRLLEQRRRETRDQILIAAGDAAERLLGAQHWKDVLPGILEMMRRSFKAEATWFIEEDGVAVGIEGTTSFPPEFVRRVLECETGGMTGNGLEPVPGFDSPDPRFAHPWVAVLVSAEHLDKAILLVTDGSEGRVHDSHSIAAVRAFAEPLAAKIARDELEQRLALTDRMELLGQMAGGVAHDINNLLTPVLGLASALAVGEADERRRRMLEDIKLAAERGRDFVEQVLLLTRRRVATEERTNLAEVVEEAVTLLTPSTPEEIRLETRIEDPTIGVIGDRTAVLRLVQNLVTNARHAIQDGPGTVLIALEHDETGEAAVLEVIDDGTGMPEEVRSRLFDPFFTTRRSRSERGLGLTIVHRIVTELGGEVQVESQQGEGTTFRVIIPSVKIDPGEDHQVSSGRRADLARGTGRILVVDDDEMVRSTTEALVASLGYEVDTADGGREAITMTGSSRYDLILSDLSMPGMDGLELIRTLRGQGYRAAAAVFTGYGEDAIARADESGVDEVIRKPISRDDLGTTIQRLIEQAEP